MVRPTGIEPVSVRWRHTALPLSYGRVHRAGREPAEPKRHLIYSQARCHLSICACSLIGAGELVIARTYVGGRLTVRTPHLAVPTRFQDGLPATPAEPSVLDVSARFERAASAFGRRCCDPLSYETKLALELRVPVEVVHPALVQIAGWKRAFGSQQLIERRLLRWPPQFDPQRVAFARVAGIAGRDDVRPGRLTTARARNHVFERQPRRRKRLAAILAGEAVAQERVEARERHASRRRLVL